VLNPLLDVTVKSPAEGSFKGTFVFTRDGAEASKYAIEAEVLKGSDGWQIVSKSYRYDLRE